MKPYAESCDQNRKPILAILKEYFSEIEHVLEVGSGTGQHAIYFSQNLPHLLWQTSDKIEHHSGLLEWLQEAKNSNVLLPIELDVNHSPWPAITVMLFSVPIPPISWIGRVLKRCTKNSGSFLSIWSI